MRYFNRSPPFHGAELEREGVGVDQSPECGAAGMDRDVDGAAAEGRVGQWARCRSPSCSWSAGAASMHSQNSVKHDDDEQRVAKPSSSDRCGHFLKRTVFFAVSNGMQLAVCGNRSIGVEMFDSPARAVTAQSFMQRHSTTCILCCDMRICRLEGHSKFLMTNPTPVLSLHGVITGSAQAATRTAVSGE